MQNFNLNVYKTWANQTNPRNKGFNFFHQPPKNTYNYVEDSKKTLIQMQKSLTQMNNYKKVSHLTV